MTRSDINFDILMKLAVNKCMEDEIALFDSLDTSDTAVSQKTRRKVMNTLRQQKLQNSSDNRQRSNQAEKYLLLRLFLCSGKRYLLLF